MSNQFSTVPVGDNPAQSPPPKRFKVEPLALPPDEAALVCGIARTRIYEAISRNELTARKLGRATIIELSELRRWINSLPIRGRTAVAANTT
jgi:excisionase family DNA binding protein